MRFYKSDDSYVVVLKLGEELFEALADFCQQSELQSGWFDAFGAVKTVELGYYHLDKQEYQWQQFEGPLEVTSLHGNIVQKDGQPVFHAHGTFFNAEYQAVGGHIKHLVVAGTLEILVSPLKTKLTRKLDDEVGLELLSD